MRVIKTSTLRKLIRESLLRENQEIIDIVTNPYEDVTDINILANYALRDDMPGACLLYTSDAADE